MCAVLPSVFLTVRVLIKTVSGCPAYSGLQGSGFPTEAHGPATWTRMADTQAGVALLTLGPRVSSTQGWSGEGRFRVWVCWEKGDAGPRTVAQVGLRVSTSGLLMPPTSESPLGQDYVQPDPHTAQPGSQPVILGAEGLLIARPGHQDALFQAYLCLRQGCGKGLVGMCVPTNPPRR